MAKQKYDQDLQGKGIALPLSVHRADRASMEHEKMKLRASEDGTMVVGEGRAWGTANLEVGTLYSWNRYQHRGLGLGH